MTGTIPLRPKLKQLAASLKEEGHTQEQIAAMLGVDQTTVGRWVSNNMHTHNVTSTSPPDNRNKLSDEQKDQIREQASAGKTEVES